MCGFLVFYPLNKNYNFSHEKFNQASELISHRGPDDKHNFFSEDIKMIFYRLNIIDLSLNGRQPMLSSTGKNLIVFNGEIYNANELRQRLNLKALRGKSDTEILLNLYEKYGHKILSQLEGMFSFLIYNFETKKCFIARDRFGIKALYFLKQKNYIIFSSEIKPIICYQQKYNLNYNSFAKFFFRQEMDNNETFFENIESLEPSTYKIFSKYGFKKFSYWTINKTFKEKSFFKTKNKYENLLLTSIKKHLLSDRKIGLLLSSGTDSTALAYFISKNLRYQLKTFTYDFSDKYSGESHMAKIISDNLKIKNFKVVVDPDYVINNMEKICYELESPFTSIRLFGLKKVFERINKEEIRVAIEGGGGDEILGGYEYNHLFHMLDKSKKKNINDLLMQILKLTKNKKNNQMLNYLMTFTYQNGSTKDCTPFIDASNFNSEFLNEFLNDEFYSNYNFPKELNFLQRSQLIDIKHINLPRSLKYTDRLAMNCGIENRVPFLDHSLASFSFNLNNNYKIKNDINRYILKSIFKKYPFANFFSKQKKTIVDPQREWMRDQLKEYIFDEFLSKKFKENFMFNQKQVVRNFEYYLKNKNSTSFGIFQIFSTHKFINTFSTKFLN